MASVPADAPTEIPVDSDAYPLEKVRRPAEDGLPADGPGSRYNQLGRGQDTAR